MAAFHDAASADGELAVALLALIEARTDFLRRVSGNRVNAGAIGVPAMAARRAIRPADRLEIGAGLVFVVEDRIGEVDRNVGSPCELPLFY